MHELLHILEHAFFDSVKILPSLFIIYLLIEFLEHRHNNRMHHLFMRAKKSGPLFGGLLGCIPQCGFSVIASELYANRFITTGTLIAVFVATSDEAIPILLAEPGMLGELGVVIALKLVFAVVYGFAIDMLFRRDMFLPHTCESEGHEHHHYHGNCEDCHGGILKSTIIHTVKIFLFIFATSVVLGGVTEYAEGFVSAVSASKWVQPFIAPLIGLIPNCAASVILTEMYVSGGLTLASLTGGLCAGAGVGLLVLFRLNKNKKQNLTVLALLYLLGVVSGLIITALCR